VEALAGTYDRGSDDSRDGLIRATEHLFGSGKDLEEHALVVCGITEALTPLCDSVTAADWPEVREARGLAHLSSQITAELRPDVSAFDLIDALHPTPAVGGLPASAAIDFIRKTEKAPRGLFASPIGWISANGDACLAVAIRSALLYGRQAEVYAGAGIVTGSDAAAEWTETGAKLRWLSEIGSRAGA
jgi:isochorismate synthase EntC